MKGAPADPISFRDVGPAGLEEVRPLWECLRDYHAALPDWPFAAEMAGLSFDGRKRELLAKSAGGELRAELALAGGSAAAVGYCVTSLTADRRGEIDSMFVQRGWRGRGVGTELVRRALAWLEARGAVSKLVAVAHDNHAAASFYARLGFVARTVIFHHRPQAASTLASSATFGGDPR